MTHLKTHIAERDHCSFRKRLTNLEWVRYERTLRFFYKTRNTCGAKHANFRTSFPKMGETF
jgi:hypothetical protein